MSLRTLVLGCVLHNALAVCIPPLEDPKGNRVLLRWVEPSLPALECNKYFLDEETCGTVSYCKVFSEDPFLFKSADECYEAHRQGLISPDKLSGRLHDITWYCGVNSPFKEPAFTTKEECLAAHEPKPSTSKL